MSIIKLMSTGSRRYPETGQSGIKQEVTPTSDKQLDVLQETGQSGIKQEVTPTSDKQLDVLQETGQSDTKQEVTPTSDKQQNLPRQALQSRQASKKRWSSKLEKILEKQEGKYKILMDEMDKRKEKHSKQEVLLADQHQRLPFGDGTIYEKKVEVYFHPMSGTHTAKITIAWEKDGIHDEWTQNSTRNAFAIALLCNDKIDAFIRNHYNSVIAQAKRKIDEKTIQAKREFEAETKKTKREIAAKYVERGTTQASEPRTDSEELTQKFAKLHAIRDEEIANEELAQKFAKLDTIRDEEFAKLDTIRDEEFAEEEKKASKVVKDFLNKRGDEYMDAKLLEGLQSKQGREEAQKERNRRKESSKETLEKIPEELQRITKEINDTIGKIQDIISRSPAVSSENHLHAPSDLSDGSETVENFETASENHSHAPSDPPRPDPMTLKNFDQKIKAYLKNPTIVGFSDPIHKEIPQLAIDTSGYPDSLGEGDKLKISNMLLHIERKLSEKQAKQDQALEVIAKEKRYTIGHYGERLLHEESLVDYQGNVAKAAGAYAEALDTELDLAKKADDFYKAGLRKIGLTPLSASSIATITSIQNFGKALSKLNDIRLKARSALREREQHVSTVEREQHISAVEQEREQHISAVEQEREKQVSTLMELGPQIMDVLDASAASALREALTELNLARLKTAAAKGKHEEAKALKERQDKLVELAKGKDDADDGLDDKHTAAIKKSDEDSLKHIRTLEQELLKHSKAERLENLKTENKEADELRHFLINLDKIEVGNVVMKERLKTMYMLALFGSGDQAALFALGRDSSTEFNSYMSLFR